ncbi:MAG TPA: hypothetical protein VF040_11360 [Ktedonobacterales bacterium]
MTQRDTPGFDPAEEISTALHELDLPADEVSALIPIIASLKAWEVPVPTATETRLFLARLEDRLAAPAAPPVSWRSHLALLWQIALRQPRLIHRSLWAGSLVAMTCALSLAWLGLMRQDIVFGLFVPVIATTGVAFLYGPEVDPALEYAKATPISTRLLVGSRLLALLSYEVALELAITAAIALHTHESFSALLALWLGPTALLSSCSLLLSLLLGPVVTAGSMFAVWLVQFIELDQVLGRFLLSDPHWQTSPLLFAGAAIILLLGFWLVPSYPRLTSQHPTIPESFS